MSRSTLARWLTCRQADTRTPGPPEGRRYAAPFAEVWDALLETARLEPRWEVRHADETAGLLTVCCRNRLPGFLDDLTVWVFLDRDGFTRVEARSRSRRGRGDLGVNRRRLERLLGTLDARFEPL